MCEYSEYSMREYSEYPMREYSEYLRAERRQLGRAPRAVVRADGGRERNVVEERVEAHL
jgi:hypothetical protein